jgi:hypothetical protein
MQGIPTLNYRLPSRRPGTFGTSQFGLVCEWLTASWLRFEGFLTWLVLLPFCFAAGHSNLLTLVGGLLFSPIAALIAVFALKVTGWVVYFIPGPNKAWGWARIAFLWAFSRLILEEAPELEVPSWSTHR